VIAQRPVLDELHDRLVETYYRRRSRSTWLELLRAHRLLASCTAAGVAVVAAAVVVLSVSAGVSPPSAQAALEQAATAAQGRSAGVLGRRDSWYAETVQTWSAPIPTIAEPALSRTPPSAGSTEIRTVSTFWIKANGDLRERSVTTAVPKHLRPGIQVGGYQKRPVTTVRMSSGRRLLISPMFPGKPLLSYRALLALPTNTLALRRVISGLQAKLATRAAMTGAQQSSARQGRAGTDGAAAVGQVVGVSGGTSRGAQDAVGKLNIVALLLALPVPGDVRAALFRTAASLPGIRDDGRSRDAFGREGVSVSVGSGAEQFRMYFDPRTGALLATQLGFGSQAARDGVGNVDIALRKATVVS
jgi:hypothetical protein